jgi:hypothetical protein
VEITTASLPTKERLAQVVELRLGVKNAGNQTIPNLAITIYTDPNAERPFSVVTNQPRAANPTRPVWVLEHEYPRLVGSNAAAGAQTANLDTFQFGPLAPGQTRDAIWRLSPVRPGTYTLTYAVAAGLTGKATAVNADGSKPNGKFLVRIASTPPNAIVTDSGKVVVQTPKASPKSKGKSKSAKAKTGGGTKTTGSY